jgi:hypothetical protein
MVKIIIIGGGIAGLSAATYLCDISSLEIELYEKEKELGGQASSLYNNNCNIEHSWRVFGKTYHNIWYIFNNILGIFDNFTTLKKNCLINNDAISNGDLNIYSLLPQILNTTKFDNYYKYFDLMFLCKNRVINSYDDINAFEYFDKNDVVKSILGPDVGLDAIKLSVSSSMKNLYQISNSKKYSFSPNDTQITNMPTSDAMFEPWEKYLLKKNVTIKKNQAIEDVFIEENKIKYVVINSKKIYADEFIFACSLKPLNKILENKYNCNTFKNMKKLEENMHLYFALNMYFNKKLNMTCDHFILLKESWQPVIQRKISWSEKIINNCKLNGAQIKEIWNVGFLDYQIGSNGKIVRDCTLEEAIQEGLQQVKNNKYINDIMQNNNVVFDEVYIGYDIWYQFKNSDENFPIHPEQFSTISKIADLNPKFSVNQGTMHYMPETHPNDIPINMHLSGYYVNNTYGGASMESSCETGLNCAKYILNRYNLKNNTILPIKHTNEYLFNPIIQLPFTKLDEILYYNNMQPITNYINSFYLFIIVIFIIIYLLFLIIRICIMKIK